MFGDFLREAAVPHRGFRADGRVIGQRATFTGDWLFVTSIISATLFAAGVLLERYRKVRDMTLQRIHASYADRRDGLLVSVSGFVLVFSNEGRLEKNAKRAKNHTSAAASH